MDLKQFLDQHGVRYTEESSHRHVREGWLGLDCPWCGSEGKFHLGVHLGTLRSSCWRCGRHDLGEALSLVARMPIGKARRAIRDFSKHTRTVAETFQRPGKLLTPIGLQSLLEPHRKWLRSRELDPDSMERLWGLQGIGLSGRLSWRIWAPVYMNGEMVSWTTRTIGNGASRWLHARPDEEVFPIKSLLYGWDYVRGSIMVVEGPSDVWRIGPGAIALFGMVPTTSQIRMLCSVPRRIICFDHEWRAQQAARRLAEQLRLFPGETLVVELKSPDPGSTTDEEVIELRKFLE